MKPDLKFATRLSVTFFSIGTLLVALYYFTMSNVVMLLGFSYTGIAVLIGTIYIIHLRFQLIAKKITRNTDLKCTGIILLNLPIAAVYFYFVMILMTTVRVTFENTTGRNISSISVGGCVNKELGDLKPGESTTVWVVVKNECSLVLFYKLDREPKLETPFDYLTVNNGAIAIYKIGSN
jgi:hypothetical protein